MHSSLKAIVGRTGPNILSNGTFDADLTGWTGTGWSFSSGTALHASGSSVPLAQSSLTLVVGQVYRISLDIVGGTTALFATPQLTGGTTLAATTAEGRGRHVSYVRAVTGNNGFRIVPGTLFDGAIDNIELRQAD